LLIRCDWIHVSTFSGGKGLHIIAIWVPVVAAISIIVCVSRRRVGIELRLVVLHVSLALLAGCERSARSGDAALLLEIVLRSLRPLRRDWWQRRLHLTRVLSVLGGAELVRPAEALIAIDAGVRDSPVPHVCLPLLLQEHFFVGIFNHLSSFIVAQILSHFLEHVSLGYFSRDIGIWWILITVGLLALPVLELVVISESVIGLSTV